MLELIFIALTIMAVWGSGDFILAILSKKYNPYFIAVWTAVSQMLMLAVIYFLFLYPASVPKDYWWMLIVIPFLSVAAFISFLKGFEVGHVSLITAVSSSYGVLAMVLSFIFLNVILKHTQYLGIAVSTAGLFLATVNLSELKNLKLKSEVKGLKFAAIAFICWGIMFTMFDKLVAASDYLTPFFFYTPIVTALNVLLWKKMKSGKKPFGLKTILIVSAVSIFLQAAFLLYTFSLKTFPSALLAPISAAYPAVTIFLSHVFLKERMTLTQYFGTVLILAGLIVASF